MSNQDDPIMRYFLNQYKAPGHRLEVNNNKSIDLLKKYDGYSRIQFIEQKYGRRAKRVLDKNRTHNNYNLYKEIHEPSLSFYENMEWWERDSSNDFYKHSKK